MQDSERFIEALRAERAAYDDFVGLLESEHGALVRNDGDALTALASAKAARAAMLADLAKARRRFLADGGFSPDSAGMERWLAASPAREAAALWSAILELGARADDFNERNGALIAARLARTRQALAALNRGSGSLYGPDGFDRTTGSGRTIGKG